MIGPPEPTWHKSYRLDLATPEDDAQLCELLRRTSMGSGIELSFRRDPSFLAAEQVGSVDAQIIVVRETDTRQVVGVASRSLREVYVPCGANPPALFQNQMFQARGTGVPPVIDSHSGREHFCREVHPALTEVQDHGRDARATEDDVGNRERQGGELRLVGYLGGLRLASEVRSGRLLAAGYRFLRGLHQDGRAPWYFTTILEDNREAQDILTSGRAGLPCYVPVGKLLTYLIPLHGRPTRKQVGELECADDPETLAGALECLRDVRSEQWLTSPLEREDLTGKVGRYPGLRAENLYVTRRGGQVVGTLGVWDQSAFKQTVVTGYHGLMRWAAPLTRRAPIRWAAPPLPRIGEELRILHGCFVSARPGTEEDFGELLDKVIGAWKGQGYGYLAVGVHERNALRTVLWARARRVLESRLYVVHWPGEGEPPDFGAAIPHPEVALL